VILGADAPRRVPNGEIGFPGGTYTSHYVLPAAKTVIAPDAIPNDQLGTIWLPYLTAWGCLVWKQNMRIGDVVAIPAASSSVGLAAAQIVKERGGIAVGLTTSEEKAHMLKTLPEATFDHCLVTHTPDGELRAWQKDFRAITQRRGVDVFFDPIAAGKYLQQEISALAEGGTIWIYGLLGEVGPVDVTPLIRKYASIRGWYLHELTHAGAGELKKGYDYILDGFARGVFRQRVAKRFALDDVRRAHEEMQRGEHIGKLVLVPQE
jgi:NADPH:quinone reductase-like Zn-dependent oxidoreductase